MRDDDRIAKLLGQLRDAVSERITALNRSLEAEQQSVAARVEQRKQLAWQLQLPERLFTIYKEVKYYPHWARNSPADVCSLITDIAVNEESVRKVQVRFFLKSDRYSFAFEEHESSAPGDYDTYYASLTLAGSNGDALFKERMSRHADQYWSGNYRISDIDALVPGDWVLNFIELSEAITTITMERGHRYRLSEIERQKRDFGLSSPDSELHKLQATLDKHSMPEDHHSTGTRVQATGGWFRRLFGRHPDDKSEAT